MSTKSKFTLAPKPTFQASVDIPRPGELPYAIVFTFKGRTREEFKEFVDGIGKREDLDVLMDILSGWDLEDAFGPDNVAKLHNSYIPAARAIIDKYLSELSLGRLGN